MTTPAPDTLEREKDVPSYVDIARLCRELCICERTADAWVKQGILPAPRNKRGKRLWKWKDVELYLDGDQTTVAPSADSEAEQVRDATRRALAETR